MIYKILAGLTALALLTYMIIPMLIVAPIIGLTYYKLKKELSNDL